MSMIAINKVEKAKHLEFLLYNLWHGQTEAVLDYLNTKVKAKNKEKLQGLIGYLEKHFEPIIDYDRRKKAGKKVGLDPSSEDEDDVVQNQTSKDSHVEKVVDNGCVSISCDNVIVEPQQHNEVTLNQESNKAKPAKKGLSWLFRGA